jgi:haloalkane dehalogenase
MTMVYGHWERYEPRPPEHEIDADLIDLLRWVADITPGMDAADVMRVAQYAHIATTWPAGSVLRTPEACFANLPDFPYPPRYVEIEGLRMAYVEHGTGKPLLLLHGEPTWGYLYRHMIPPLAQLGRVIVPDLIGFGRSDKPVAEHAYSYKAHVRWLRQFLEALALQEITLVCQDWGGLLGLRLLAYMPERFARLVAMNTGFPDGHPPGDAFMRWRRFAQRQQALDIPRLMRRTVRRPLTEAEANAYGAPFPQPEYQTAALVFPRLVPTHPDHPGAYNNRLAIATLKTLELPVLLPWADSDPITGPWETQLRAIFRHVAPPLTIPDAGHFLQEDAGPEIAEHIRRWLAG